MSDSDLVTAAFDAVDRKLRSASAAEIGGFRPPDDPLTSWFGGSFALPGPTEWPTNAHGPLVPLLQVVIGDLPIVPEPLCSSALAQIYVDNTELPVDLPATNGEGWEIRLYPSLTGLSPQPTPSTANQLQPLPVRWRLITNEAPSWDDAWAKDRSHDDFIALDDSITLFHDRYTNHPGTKIGGWPAWIQGAFGGDTHFVCQISSEAKSHWVAGDSGNTYIFFGARGWSLMWDCY